MPYRKPALRLTTPVAVLALALTACGGVTGDDTADADAKRPATPQAAKASPSEAATGGGMATGESATGKYAEDPGEVTYEILAEKVDVGTEAEARKVVADPEDAKGRVLTVAHVRFTHRSGPALTDSTQVGVETTVWADGQRGSVLIGAAEDSTGCEDPYGVESWKQGESHVFCETYLVPVGAKNVEVHWAEQDGEPYIWKFANS